MPSIFLPFDSSCNFTLENDVLRLKNMNMEKGLQKNYRTLPHGRVPNLNPKPNPNINPNPNPTKKQSILVPFD